MARYPLILRDETYAKALNLAARQRKTLGRWLNDLVEAAVAEAPETAEVKAPPSSEGERPPEVYAEDGSYRWRHKDGSWRRYPPP